MQLVVVLAEAGFIEQPLSQDDDSETLPMKKPIKLMN